MSFFPLYASDRGFAPLFRLLDDFDSYSREGQPNQTHGHRHPVRSFNPKFDVRETQAAYELHGELPGLHRDNVQIEFTEPQTLVVRGRIDRAYTAGTPPAGVAVDGNLAQKSITETTGQPTAESTVASHQPTVEDFVEVEQSEAGQATPTESPKTEAAQLVAEKPAERRGSAQTAKAPAEKYWVSERSVGQFSRTFNLPARVDQDAVTANLNNGILTVVVPKAKKHEPHRIMIN